MTVCACVYKWQFHTKKKKTTNTPKKLEKAMNRKFMQTHKHEKWSVLSVIKKVQFFQNRDLFPFRLAGCFLF